MKKTLVLLILILASLAIFGYYYSNKTKPNSNLSSSSNDLSIDINDDSVKKLYNYLHDNKLFIMIDNYKTIYQDKLITYNDLTKYTILRNVFYELNKENAPIDMYNKEMFSSNIMKLFNTQDNNIIEYADKCTFNNNDCIIPISFDLKENTGYYQIVCDVDEMCIWTLNGNNSFDKEPLYKLIKAEKTNDEYYLYDSVFYSDGKNLYDKYSDGKVIYTSPNDNLIDYKFVEENYKDYLFTYKHTYKQNGIGKYYWYSTEPVTK